jgi:FkbM family methyltransferase
MENIWNSLHGVGNNLDHGEDKNREKQFVDSLNIEGFKCLDIGFNYGWWSWLFLKNIGKDGKVYAWEPNNFLYENYLAKWPLKNLVGYNYAVSDKTGEQDFYVYSDKETDSAYNSLEKLGNREPKEIRKLQTRRLDDWWSEHGGPNVDFIKIDCEGHDLKILEGGRSLIETTRPSYIVIEQADQGVKEFMRSENYTDQNSHNKLGLVDTVWIKGDAS